MHIFIQSFGAKLAVRNGLFEVTTIENQQYLKHEYAPDELNELWVQNGCSITTAAIHLAMENDIDLLVLNHFGMPVGRFTPIRPSSIISIQRGQLLAAQNKMGLELVKSWIGKKMDNQALLLAHYCQNHRSNNANKALITKHIEQIRKYKNNLEAIEAAHVAEVADTLRGIEGIQRTLQDYLQAVYFQLRPRCVHGAITSAADEAKPRNLLTNAKAHLGKKFFLNVDLKNFYHTISQQKVLAMFGDSFFHFPPKVAALLTKLVCYQNRLPMGTSTSGIVANLCLLELDSQLQTLADNNGWTYSRFIDDLTFSAKNPFTTEQKTTIRAIIGTENLVINEEKWSETTIDEQPEITGLVIQGGRIDIKPNYIKQLGADITLYRKLLKSEHLHKSALFSATVLRHFKLHLQGQLSFMRYIRGKMDVAYVRLANRMKVRVAV